MTATPRVCAICADTGEVPGTHPPDLCPRCVTPVLTAHRDQRRRRNFMKRTVRHSTAAGVDHFILLALALHADEYFVAALTFPEIAHICRISVDSVRRGVVELLESRMLHLIRKGCGRGVPDQYYLNVLSLGIKGSKHQRL